MGRSVKFERLFQYFNKIKDDELTLTFDHIEKILGEKLSNSAYKYPAYWSHSETHTITKCWLENGYRIAHLNLKEQNVTFKKDGLKRSDLIKCNLICATNKNANIIKQIQPAVSIDKVLSSINKYIIDLEVDENARYLSWEHCYTAFQNARNKPSLNDEDLDNLSLHLAFYLSSWGMLRGSSFLLQKDYKVHVDIIKELFKPDYKSLWGIGYIELQNQQNLNILMDLVDKMKTIYRTKRMSVKESDSDISDILITKVLLGTMGCVPAYDRYFKKGVSNYKIASQMFGMHSILKLLEYYKDNESELEQARNSISKTRQIEYPQMKILDMAFWQLGYDI